MAEPVQETMGRYRLLALLATGGMAEIHLARQTGIQGFERLAVVKRILPHLAKEKRFLEMFFNEARIAAQLNHPNIVQIYELGQEGQHYYIAMEYLEGESLAFLVHEAKRAQQPLPPELAAGIVIQVCDGLDFAHNLNDELGKPMRIVHRDVTPQNIIVLSSGGVKLVDFGIAKAATQAHQTRVGTLKGKLSYMSPEQCRSRDLDARSDVFSLGIVLWELLARRRLFKHDDEVGTIHAIVYEDIPAIRAVRPEVPAELEAVAMRALRKDPAERFPSAGEMGEALRAHLRWVGAAAGPREIAEYMNTVFAERARTKRKLLEDIRRSNGQPITLGVLKPDTYESLPPGSDESKPGARSQVDADAAAPLDLEAAPTHVHERAPRRALWIIAGLVAIILAATTWLLWPSAPPARQAPAEEPAGRDLRREPAVPPAPMTGPADAGPSAPEPARPAKALLSLRSTPAGCAVELDGQVLATRTPVQALEVEPGVEHALAISCPGHRLEERRLTLAAGQAEVLDLRPPADRPRPPAPAPAGQLKIDTEPWSEVYLGKRKLGTTPIAGVRLPAGTHALTAVNPEMGLRKTFRVTIEAGKTVTVFKELSP